jgi:prevent-host-death family protein
MAMSSSTTTVSATDARASLPDLLDRVAGGEEITITRHGEPVAVLVRPDALRSRRAEHAFRVAATVRDALDAGRRSRLSDAGGLSEQRAEALLREVRASRAAR